MVVLMFTQINMDMLILQVTILTDGTTSIKMLGFGLT